MPAGTRVFTSCRADQVYELAQVFVSRPGRRITEVHFHHTWIPNRLSFEDLASKYNPEQAARRLLEAMLRNHTETRGFKDIAQHVTIDPRGTVWLCRSWNEAPASATGYNGNSHSGPFMIETIGNFDTEQLDGAQRKAVIQVIASIQKAFGLPKNALRFHNEMSSKSCPGTTVVKKTLIEEIGRAHDQIAASVTPTRRQPLPERNRIVNELIDQVSVQINGRDPPDAELPEHEMNMSDEMSLSGVRDSLRGGREPITADMLRSLEHHLVNLEQGHLSTSGLATSSPATIGRLCRSIGEWVDESLKNSGTANILLYAHGGLTSELSALRTAYNQHRWWLENGIYPVFFVWETGALETIFQLISQTLQAERERGLLDEQIDSAIEWIVRKSGRPIWATMKRSAERAFEDVSDRGGKIFLKKLNETLATKNRQDKVLLHCVGHSAGAIFHSHLIQEADKLSENIRSIHFLAPASTTTLFKKSIMPLLDSLPQTKLSIFTMDRAHELDDNCANLYRKSLLYLVSRGCEKDVPSPILGLQESILEDSDLAEYLGVGNRSSNQVDIIWSPSSRDDPNSRTQATSHADFDNDKDTMESVAIRISGTLVSPFPEAAQRAFQNDLQLFTPLSETAGYSTYFSALRSSGSSKPAQDAEVSAYPLVAVSQSALLRPGVALCIGIDSYPTSPLSGCVNDIREWETMLSNKGYRITSLREHEATYDRMVSGIAQLIDRASPGESIVIAYAGHGTQVPDLDGDETSGEDQALVPVDFAGGKFLIDDDIRELLSRIKSGVDLTIFLDCCHSGTATRFAVGASASPSDVKFRYLPVSEEVQLRHKEFRQNRRLLRTLSGTGGVEQMKHVLFAACQDRQTAKEQNGRGYFSLRMLDIIANSRTGLSNKEIVKLVEAAFAGEPSLDQTPRLDASTAGTRSPFLGGL